MLRTLEAKRALPSRSRSRAAAAVMFVRVTRVVYTRADGVRRVFPGASFPGIFRIQIAAVRALGATLRRVDRPQNYMTKDGAKRLADELRRLVETERPKVVQEVSDAAAQGDRSENAEYI